MVAYSMTERARELVNQMADAGELPAPALMEEILAQGEDAVDPLLEVIRRDLHGWPEEAPIDYALGLLSDLRSPRAVPDVVNILRRYDGELLDEITYKLARFGAPIVDPLCEIIQDRSLTSGQRSIATEGAQFAAGDDLALRARVAEVLREELSVYLGSENQPEDYALSTWLVVGLANLADPLGRDLVRQAFERDLVETFVIDERCAEELYAKGGDTRDHTEDRWIDTYEEFYNYHTQQNIDRAEELLRLQEDPLGRLSVGTGDSASEPLPPPIEPIRKAAHRPGRNDPCWCGSGKKYKKCHLASDEAGV